MKLLIPFALLIAVQVGFAQVPNWEVESISSYQYTMNVTSSFFIDKVESSDVGDMVGVFLNDTCRGVSSLSEISELNTHLSFLTVYSHEARGEELEIRLYDASSDEVVIVDRLLEFESDLILGTPDLPYVFDHPLLSTGAELLSFSAVGFEEVAEIDPDNKTVFIQVNEDVDVSQVIADFTLSAEAAALIGSQLQESGVTENDYSETLVYTVVAENPSVRNEWRVTIAAQKPNGLFDELQDNRLELFPNPSTDFVHLANGGYGDYQIVNFHGEVVMTGSFSPNTLIDISGLESGVYYLKEGGRLSLEGIRIVKE